MKKLSAISTKFSHYTWFIGLLGCLAILFVAVDSEIGLLKRLTANEIARIFDAANIEVEKFFFKDQTLVSYLEKMAHHKKPGDFLKWIGDNLRQGRPQVNFEILDSQGILKYVSNPRYKHYLGLDFSHLDLIRSKERISRVHQSFFSSRPVVTVSYPLKEGVLLIEKDMVALAERLEKIPRPSMDASQIFILTAEGTVIFHQTREMIRTRANLLSRFEGWQGPDASGFYTVSLGGERYWCMKKGFSYPKSWFFYAAIPQSKILPYLWHHMWSIVMTIFAIFMAIVFLVDFLISHGISKPLKDISDWLLRVDPLKPDLAKHESRLKIPSVEFFAIVESVKKMLETIKEKNREILQRDELFRTVIEYAADWAYWLDESGRFKYNSLKCKEITGYSPEEFQEDPDLLKKIIFDADRPFFEEHLRSAVTDQPHKNLEFRIVTRDGNIRWISHNCNKIYDSSGKFLGVRGSNLDITEQKLASEELSKIEKLESLGVVAGGIAHDFNNLLTAILGNISLAKMEADPSSSIYKRLEASEKASIRAQNLTQQLLTFAKGGTPVKRRSSLKRIILETAEFALKGSNVACKFDFEKDLWMVEVDPGQISQVLHNLILNADQAMPHGGIIRIKAKNASVQDSHRSMVPPGDYVVINVQDEGCGIPKELVSKIFDPYFTTKEKGSGLGLAVCFSIVRKHGGFITVESAPEKGTTFHIYLPALREIIPDEPKEQASIFASSKGKRILIMDDDPNVLQLLSESLRYLGHKSETARDGNEAIMKYQEAMKDGQPFDAVIMDLTIPGGMGGREAAARLLETDPRAKIIVSSGYSKDNTITNYKQYGFCASLPKPYKLETISRVLLSVFSG